jgi:hypothetical protein
LHVGPILICKEIRSAKVLEDPAGYSLCTFNQKRQFLGQINVLDERGGQLPRAPYRQCEVNSASFPFESARSSVAKRCFRDESLEAVFRFRDDSSMCLLHCNVMEWGREKATEQDVDTCYYAPSWQKQFTMVAFVDIAKLVAQLSGVDIESDLKRTTT